MESTLPITTTKRMAASVRPNHSSASGSQQMEGSACSPITTGFTALRNKASRALASPRGTPMPTEMRYARPSRPSERSVAEPSRPSAAMA